MNKKKHLFAKSGQYQPEMVDIKDLHLHVKVENPYFLDRIKDSISEFGMQNPVVAAKITIGGWKLLQSYNKDILNPPEGDDDDIILQVRCGHNRVRAAIDLGYDSIDCIVLDKIKDSTKYCTEMREQQNRWMRRNQFGKW